MSRTEALRDWFQTEVPGISGSMNELPEGKPERAFAVVTSGNLGLQTEEEIFDRPTFFLFIRGVNGGDAEDWAYKLTNAWIDAPAEFFMGDFSVKGKGLFGGPQRLGKDENEEHPGRVVWSATLWARMVRAEIALNL